MKRILFLALCLASTSALAAGSSHAAKTGKHEPVKMSVAQIVSKNVAARGGLNAWRAVHTLTLSGRLEAGGKENPDLPFVMKMKRPHKSRLEIRFEDKTALQVYNGHQGWKVRPFLGRDEVEPYTNAEARAAETWQELDGPLVDYASKGTKVKMIGYDTVEGHKTYELKLTLKSGDVRRVWIDAENFLERKIDGEPRRMDGKMRAVTIFYRDFRTEKGLVVPHVFETVVEGGQQSHKLYIESVAVNQPMDEMLFMKPDPAMVMSAGESSQMATPQIASDKRPASPQPGLHP